MSDDLILPEEPGTPPAGDAGPGPETAGVYGVPRPAVPKRLPVTPRFEPIVNPLILVLGIVGLLVLVGVGLLLFIPSFP